MTVPAAASVPSGPLPENVPLSEMMGEIVCLWWADLRRDQRVWVYNTALAAAQLFANDIAQGVVDSPPSPAVVRQSDHPGQAGDA